jgi:hypothetical protein
MQVDVQEWILVIGGIGIVCGLALFSSNISRCLGVQVAKITFARGFSAEFGTAITVAIASRYGVDAFLLPCRCGGRLVLHSMTSHGLQLTHATQLADNG